MAWAAAAGRAGSVGAAEGDEYRQREDEEMPGAHAGIEDCDVLGRARPAGERAGGGEALTAHTVRIEGNEIMVGPPDYADRHDR